MTEPIELEADPSGTGGPQPPLDRLLEMWTAQRAGNEPGTAPRSAVRSVRVEADLPRLLADLDRELARISKSLDRSPTR